jgi:hypothetical protein
MKKYIIIPFLLFIYFVSAAQLSINTPVFIGAGAEITVVNQDVIATADFIGSGALRIKNSSNVSLNCNGNQIPNLIIDASAAALINLNSNVIINNNLQFVNGSIYNNSSDLILNTSATTFGANATSYIVTNATGKVIKNVNSNVVNFNIPIGTIVNYAPLAITTNGTYAAGANVAASAKNAIHPNKPSLITDYFNVYWPLSRSGITGNVDAAATYVDGTNTIGTEPNIKAAMYTSSGWQNDGTTNNVVSNNNGASLTTANADLYGMNTFVQLSAKAFLQGAYNIGSLKMNDNLRTPTNLIPLSDPYRVAPLNTSFTQINNAVTEVASASIFTNQAIADNNIVDWVFVELRNGVLGNNKIKTRSALIQKDGDIVDVDGTSPLFFKDIPPGQYTIAIRHRNHLGLATDPITNLQNLNMKLPIGITDFTTFTDAQLFGKADSNYKLQGTKNLLYAGNANSNTKVSFSGLNNDKDRIFSKLSNQPNNLTVSNVYDASDINMNRFVRFVNLNNDKDFLFGILGSSATNSKNQALP